MLIYGNIKYPRNPYMMRTLLFMQWFYLTIKQGLLFFLFHPFPPFLSNIHSTILGIGVESTHFQKAFTIPTSEGLSSHQAWASIGGLCSGTVCLLNLLHTSP